jgi:hypothetical protein
MNTDHSEKIRYSLEQLDNWVSRNGWLGYDPFDGLSAPVARKLTFENPLLRIALQQSVRRLPFNIRSILGITKKHSNQAMGYFATGYLRLFSLSGDQVYLDKAIHCLSDLMENRSPGYAGYSWGWAFDYQSRGHYLSQGIPSIVWTSFIAHAFLDAYDCLSTPIYLDVAQGVGQAILNSFPKHQISENSLCISYVPDLMLEIHNANMLAASVLARLYKYTQETRCLDIAQQAIRYTMEHQRGDGSWYYGEGLRWHWVDGYHTGFILDSLYWYQQSTGDKQYELHLKQGMEFYRKALFDDAVARHYDNQTYPIDIQSIAQAIQTFSLIPELFNGDLSLAEKAAIWAIENMQDPSGYFYFRKGRMLLNKTPFLHWGQSTMLAALALLVQRTSDNENQIYHHTIATEAK